MEQWPLAGAAEYVKLIQLFGTVVYGSILLNITSLYDIDTKILLRDYLKAQSKPPSFALVVRRISWAVLASSMITFSIVKWIRDEEYSPNCGI